MTQEETYRILGILKRGYPGYFRQMGRAEAEGIADLWGQMLIDYPVELVAGAVERFLVQDTKGYPPSIGQVIASINAIQRPPVNEMTESEAWSRIKSALSNGAYNSQTEFDKLPRILQKIVGSSERLHDWALMDADLVENSIRPMICRSYTQQADREREQTALPPSMARQLASMVQRETIPEPQKQAIQPPQERIESTETGQGYLQFLEALKGLAEEKAMPEFDNIRDYDAEARARNEAQAQALREAGAV